MEIKESNGDVFRIKTEYMYCEKNPHPLKKTVEQFKPFAFSDSLRTETRQD